MRSQLETFSNFANGLLPHETAYLLSIQKFKDHERLNILERVNFNAQHIKQFTPYDTSIDKRKYNHLQNWIQARLKAIDLDEHFNWLLEMEQKVMTDAIQEEEERALLKAIQRYEHPGFYFSKFYEIVKHYRHFLLIRMRHTDHQKADEFLKTHAKDYERSKDIYEKAHQATQDVVQQYARQSAESQKWENWLSAVYYNDKIEGHLRYVAMVRLVFIAYNYRRYHQLKDKLEHLDEQLHKGHYYSKRLLLNYYNNRLMMHWHFKEYEEAVKYGYLSIRAKTHDHLLYVNNLCAVLLRLERNQEALQLMKKTAQDAKRTRSFYNRIGYVAFYMQALNRNAMYKNARSYGDSFLKAYHKEIIQFRWHLFFSVYLEAMMYLKEYEKLLKTAKKYKLISLNESYKNNAGYLPNIPFYLYCAQYKEGHISYADFEEALEKQSAPYLQADKKSKRFERLLQSVRTWVPELKKPSK